MSKRLPFEVCVTDIPSVAAGEGASLSPAKAGGQPTRCPGDAVGVFTLWFLLSLFLFPGRQRLLLFQSFVSFVCPSLGLFAAPREIRTHSFCIKGADPLSVIFPPVCYFFLPSLYLVFICSVIN